MLPCQLIKIRYPFFNMGYILAYVYADGNDLEEGEINDREKKAFNYSIQQPYFTIYYNVTVLGNCDEQ